MFKCSTRVDVICTYFFILSNVEKVYHIIILIRVDFVCTHFLYIWSQSETTFTCIGSVNVTGIIQPGKNKCKCKSYLRKHGVSLQAQQHTHWHQGWLFSNSAIVYAVSTLKIIWRETKFYTKNSKWKNLISWKNESRSKWKFCPPPLEKPIQTSGAVLWKCKKWERSNFTIFWYKFLKAII